MHFLSFKEPKEKLHVWEIPASGESAAPPKEVSNQSMVIIVIYLIKSDNVGTDRQCHRYIVVAIDYFTNRLTNTGGSITYVTLSIRLTKLLTLANGQSTMGPTIKDSPTSYKEDPTNQEVK